MPRTTLNRWEKAAFTLTELIIAMAVLTLLTGIVAQLVNSTTQVTSVSRKHMDADSQAREVFDRMARDFGKMLKRTDVDYLFSKQIGNDRMFFYSESPAYSGSTSFGQRSSVALLGYRINEQFQFERLGKSLTWGDSAISSGSQTATPGGVVFLTYPPPTTAVPKPTPLPGSRLENNWPKTIGSTPNYIGVDDDYHVLSDQVCRFEFCFQLKDGTYSVTPDGGSSTDTHSLKNVTAIAVGLVILDAASQKITDLATVSHAFDDPSNAELSANPPVLMGQKWRTQLFATDFAQKAKIPTAAAAHIRIYERQFSLNSR